MSRYVNLSAKTYWEKILENDDVDAALFSSSCDHNSQKELFRKYVTVVNIETSSYCNRVCDYCPNSMIDRRSNKRRMDLEVLKKVVRELAEVSFSGRVSMNLYNEPLADEKFPEFVQVVRSALPDARISANSNGDYLNADCLERLGGAGLDELYVTLHVIPGEEYTNENRIERLIQFYQRQDVTPKVLGFESLKRIRTGYSSHGVNVEVMCSNWGAPAMGNSRAQKIEFLNIVGRDWPCARPFREITIAHTGDAFPCCQFLPEFETDKAYSSGMVGEAFTVFEVYSSPLYSQFRRELFLFSKKKGVCGTCSERICTEDHSSAALRERIAIGLQRETVLDLP